MVKIKITNHARKRAKERGIELNWIELILKIPDEVIDVKFGRKAAYKQFNDDFVVVIFEEQKDEITVITTLKVDKGRLRRYGFSRI